MHEQVQKNNNCSILMILVMIAMTRHEQQAIWRDPATLYTPGGHVWNETLRIARSSTEFSGRTWHFLKCFEDIFLKSRMSSYQSKTSHANWRCIFPCKYRSTITIEHLGKAKSLHTQPTYHQLAQLPWLLCETSLDWHLISLQLPSNATVRAFPKRKAFRQEKKSEIYLLPVTKCRSCLWFCNCTCWDVGSANQDKCGLKTVVRWRSFSNKIWRRIQKAEDFCCGLGTCDMCEEVRMQHHKAVCNDKKDTKSGKPIHKVWSKLWPWYLSINSINTTSLAKSNSLPTTVYPVVSLR